jgi:hypothetical protein
VSYTRFLAIAVALAMLLSACGGKSHGTGDSSATLSRTAGAAVTAVPTPTGDAAVVNNALDNLTKQKSLRAEVTTGRRRSTGQGVIEAVLPDKFHLTFNGGGLGNLELITLGDTTYTKSGDAWTKSSGQSVLALDLPSLTQQIETITRTAGVTKGAPDSVNGQPCEVYNLEDSQSKSTTQACIADNLPLRLVISMAGTKITVTFTEFNGNIDIKAPV